MLFNSYHFLFVFLPVVLFGSHLIGKTKDRNLVVYWIIGSSLFFYGWWNPIYLVVLLLSITFNYLLGYILSNNPSKTMLTFGILVNLLTIVYFKYFNFFIES